MSRFRELHEIGSHFAFRDYYQIHSRLREYFDKRASEGDEQAPIEKAYHALALGDPEPAIALAISAQRTNLTMWKQLMEAIAQAPTGLMQQQDIKQQASEALSEVKQSHQLEAGVAAIVLYTWLLTASERDTKVATSFTTMLGDAYYYLSGGYRQANLETAITCYQAALQVYTQEAYPYDWAEVQNSMGAAYGSLPSGDRQANLERAIACYQAALQVWTHAAYPNDWALAQNNLGLAYNSQPGGDRQTNLEKAIAYYQAALQVYTQEASSYEWARTQNSLGAAYSSLPRGDQQANLEKAIACYQAALQVYTQETYPYEWARTQNNLGLAYSSPPHWRPASQP